MLITLKDPILEIGFGNCQAPVQVQGLVHSWSFQYQSYSVPFRLDNLDQEVMLFLLCHPTTSKLFWGWQDDIQDDTEEDMQDDAKDDTMLKKILGKTLSFSL